MDLEEQYNKLLKYCYAKVKNREQAEDTLIYDEIQNSWGDSVVIIYVVTLLALIAVAATLSGVFSEEISLKTADSHSDGSLCVSGVVPRNGGDYQVEL